MADLKRRHHLILLFMLACITAAVLTSCSGIRFRQDLWKNIVPEKGKSTEESTGSSGSEKKKQKNVLALKSGRKVEVTRNGKITKKAVYYLKSGTKLMGKEIKKLGGPGMFFRAYEIKKGSRVYKRIYKRSFRPNSNIKLKDLRYIKVLHYGFDKKIKVGEIIVNAKIAGDTKKIFRELYDIKYQIKKMKLVDDYWVKGGTGTDADNKSMNDDNTSGFNYRMVAGTSTVSMHGYGRAIDVNPFENPWCPGGKLYHNQQKSYEYADRNRDLPHMIKSDSRITGIFKKHGFRWLGETATRDYQHFEK